MVAAPIIELGGAGVALAGGLLHIFEVVAVFERWHASSVPHSRDSAEPRGMASDKSALRGGHFRIWPSTIGGTFFVLDCCR
jgi:hypothetical protein